MDRILLLSAPLRYSTVIHARPCISRVSSGTGGGMSGAVPSLRQRCVVAVALAIGVASGTGCESSSDPRSSGEGGDAGSVIAALSVVSSGQADALPCRFQSDGVPTALEIQALGSRWVVEGVEGPAFCPGRGFWLEGNVISLCPGSCAVVAEDQRATVVPYGVL